MFFSGASKTPTIGGLEGLAREVGPSDPAAWMYAARVNDNEQQSKHRNRDDPRRSTPRHTMGLGILQQVWAFVTLACAVAVIRWGPETSSDRLRRCARCSACGHKGATIQHPGWGGADIGFLPFPVS